MTWGSTLLCLSLNTACLPEPPHYKSVRFSAEAYLKAERPPLDKRSGAACRPCTDFGQKLFFIPSYLIQIAFMNLMPLGSMAEDLHYECSLDEVPSNFDAISDENLGTDWAPLSLREAVSSPCQSPISTLRNNGEAPETEWHAYNEDQGDPLVDRPTIPLNLNPEWVQQLHAAWTDFQASPFAELHSEPTVRTWYLHPERYPRCRTWRVVRLPQDFNQWFQILRQSWFDLIEHEQGIEFHVVSPHPPRDPHSPELVCDVILSQGLGPHQATAVIATKFVGFHIRIHLEADILPQHTSKWELIFHLELDRFCGGPAWCAIFHRLCQVWHDYRLVRADPFPVHLGDCFVIELAQPVPINEPDHDDIVLLAQQPRLVQPEPALVDNPNVVHLHDVIGGDTDDDSHSENEIDSDFSRSAIIFTKGGEGVVGRIDPSHPNGLYGQAADMIGVSHNRLLMLYELPAPPIDLRESHDHIWIANRLGDLRQGSHCKFVLLDVRFCDALPRLDPEVVRQVKLLVSPMTRTTLLQVLGLSPYCASWPCLVQVNQNFVPQTAPFSVRHGDYINVVISPPEPIACAPDLQFLLCTTDSVMKRCPTLVRTWKITWMLVKFLTQMSNWTTLSLTFQELS